MDADMEALIARHDERLKAVETQIEKLDTKIDDLKTDIHEIKLLIAKTQGQAQGVWWAMMAFGAAGGAIASMVMKYFPFFR
jgi:hypothetical protein